MITYRGFIGELKPLVAEARGLSDAERFHEDPRFRKWRNSVTQLLAQIDAQNYQIKCQIKRRQFGAYYTENPAAMSAAYEMELQDTINELEFIIGNFENHGEPPKGTLPKDGAQLEWPAKITLAWLFRHAPWGVWTGLVALLVAAFLLGTQIGQSKLYRQFVDALQPSQTGGQK
jgi:hypothetical protein